MVPSSPVVVTLPDEIDVTNAERVFNQICAALDADVVIADLSATVFCDSSGLRHLLLAERRAGASGTRLRFAIPPDGPVHRVLELTGARRRLDVYPDLAAAASA